MLCHMCKQELPEERFSPFARNATKPSNRRCRQCANEKLKEYQANNREKIKEYNRRYEEENREKRNAKREVQRALETDRLEKFPCVVCGSENSQAHHYSYEEKDWLSVIWLCQVHHKEVHAGKIDQSTLPITRGSFLPRRQRKLVRQALEGRSLHELYDMFAPK